VSAKKKLAILAAFLAMFFSVQHAELINGASQGNSPAAPQLSSAPGVRSLAGQSQTTAPLASSNTVRDESLPPEPVPQATSSQASPELTRVVNAVIARENQLITLESSYTPRMEIYIQYLRPEPDLGAVPVTDSYFLGRMQFHPDGTLTARSLLPGPRGGARAMASASEPSTKRFGWPHLQPFAFYSALLMVDRRFNREHYDFEYVRQEFLGSVRCLVFDVHPKPHRYHGFLSGNHSEVGLFIGRIWVEDHDYSIMRFNGTFTPAPANLAYFHFDSWRQNVQPGLWLPVYAYSEESGIKYGRNRTVRFRAQIRFWGYGLENPSHQSEMTRIEVDAPDEVKDSAESGSDYSPVASQREWQEQAQNNVLERLQKAGLLAPPGNVDKVLETVVNNLVVTNHLDNSPTVRCRVLLTSTLESLVIGNTVVLSRGLIDVLPDEPSLAAVLAHELAHIVLQNTLSLETSKWAFEDRLMVRDEELLKYLNFQPSEHVEAAADAKALQLLTNSPYKDQLGKAGLFLRAMANMAPHTPQLFGAHLGGRLAQGDHALRVAALLSSAPQLETGNVDQIAALPLGARVKVDAWSDAAELMKTKPTALLSAREKMPFQITPLFPYLTRLPSQRARR
jgi:hypothetical protein